MIKKLKQIDFNDIQTSSLDIETILSNNDIDKESIKYILLASIDCGNFFTFNMIEKKYKTNKMYIEIKHKVLTRMDEILKLNYDILNKLFAESIDIFKSDTEDEDELLKAFNIIAGVEFIISSVDIEVLEDILLSLNGSNS